MRLRSCVMAVGVSDIAAFRGRSLGLLVVFSLEVDGFVESATGLDFWASLSVTLILAVSCWPGDGTPCCPVIRCGLVSFTVGFGPAIDVSGIFALRGGGGTGSSE